MRIIIGPEALEADRITLEKEGITSLDLMERAVSRFVEALEKKVLPGTKGLVMCGPGNNGADGLVLARLWAKRNSITVVVPSIFKTFSPNHEANKKKLPKNVTILQVGLSELEDVLQGIDWVCDALFGVGLNRPLDKQTGSWIERLNQFTGFRFSIDMPSGLLPEMETEWPAFQAHWVGTFQCPKLAFFFPQNFKFVQEFEVIDIGLILPKASSNSPILVTSFQIKSFYKPRKKFAHKGNFGHGLLMAGSMGKIGAAVLGAKAMLRSGIGLATVFGPKVGRDVLQVAVPEAMYMADEVREVIASTPPIGHFSAIGIGPGIGTASATAEVLGEVLERSVAPLVLDADALNILSLKKEWIKKIPPGSILTPHLKEFERLVGKSKTDFQAYEKALSFALRQKVILVLKGAYTLIAMPDGSHYFNQTGNPGMATGGSGDVLTGVLLALLAQGYTPEQAALMGVYVHGVAGDMAAERHGMEGMIAGDITIYLGPAFKTLHS